MNWKKIKLFLTFLMTGVLIFGAINVFTSSMSLFLPIFLFGYMMLLVSILRAYSKRKMIVLIALVIVYLLIMVIHFPSCYSTGIFGSKPGRDCTCIGIEKHFCLFYGTSLKPWEPCLASECVGIRTNYACYEWFPSEGIKRKVPCDSCHVWFPSEGIKKKVPCD